MILVLFFFILIFCLWLKRKIYLVLVLVFHLIFQPMLVFFFQAVDYMLHGKFFVLKVFPGRWALPHLALTVVWPWAGHEFQDLGSESFTRMWRLDISSLHLWYQQCSTKKIKFQDVNLKNYSFLYAKRNDYQGPNIRCLLLSRVWVWTPRRQNFTQTFLECTPQVLCFFLRLVSLWNEARHVSCSSSVGINTFVFS